MIAYELHFGFVLIGLDSASFDQYINLGDSDDFTNLGDRKLEYEKTLYSGEKRQKREGANRAATD